MKKIFLSLAAMFCLSMFAVAAEGDLIFTSADESLPGKPSFKGEELADGTVAITALWLTEATDEIVIPAKIWSKDDPYPEYEVSQVGNGYVLWVELDEVNVALSAMKTLTVSEGIKVIASSLMNDWDDATLPVLETLNLPSTLESIGSAAFQTCDNLKAINCKAASAPELVESSAGWTDHFKGFADWNVIGLNCKIYVPSEAAKASYQTYDAESDTGWTYWDMFFDNGNVEVKEETATKDVSSQMSEIKCQKVVRNGQIYIVREGAMFTLTGAEVK
ncbi:MAG: hypothetical protein J5612_00335 [Paludibacteraceae bacterium]|nr:hypothetical protein [Paludibacteraceae bacterium]